VASPRTAAAGAAEARTRLRAAQAYLEVAELVLDEPGREEFSSVSAGLSVLAGIAAADAICARRLGQIHRGQQHREAAGLVERAVPDGAKLATTFLRLIDLKDAAHYGIHVVAAGKAADAARWARLLVERAREEVER
jgi:hypothetical protein